MSIHPTAIIDPKAELDSTVEVGPYCVIDANVQVGRGCRLMHGVNLTGWTTIGEDCTLHPGVIVGHAPQDLKYDGAKSYCRVGSDNTLREYVTIHRGTDPESTTVVGNACFLMVASHVGHNAVVGDGVILGNGAMLGGHVRVGEGAILAGMVGVHQFVRIGELCMITGPSRITTDIVPFALVNGEAHVSGVNGIGLRRAGMSTEERNDIRRVFRTIFAAGRSFQRAVEEAAEHVETDAGRRILDFVNAESKRGYAKRARKQKVEESDE